MDNVTSLGIPPKFAKEGELARRMNDLIMEYAGEISMVAVLGVMQVISNNIMNGNDDGSNS